MKYCVLSVLDLVARQYGRPFYTVNEASAVRGFSDEVNRPEKNSVLYLHPDDFQLFLLGTFDDSDCTFEFLSSPKLLVSGPQVRVSE